MEIKTLSPDTTLTVPLDASAIKELVCARRYQIRCVFGIQPEESKYAKYGSVVHRYLEMLAKEEEVDLFKIAEEYKIENIGSILSIKNQLDTLISNNDIPLQDNNGNKAIEWKFCYPYATIAGYTIYLSGTIDRIDISDQSIRVLDFKTTSKRGIPEVMSEFLISFQMPFYLFNFNALRHLFPDANGEVYGCYKVIFLSYVPIVVQESSRIYPINIDKLLEESIQKAIKIWQLGDVIAEPEGICYGVCKSCSYFNFCSIKDPDKLKDVLLAQKASPYNPLTHR